MISLKQNWKIIHKIHVYLIFRLYVLNIFILSKWGSNRTNNIDGAEADFGCPTMQYSNQDASRKSSLLCKQTTDNFRTRPPPELPMAPPIG